jgi:hypothetical protein
VSDFNGGTNAERFIAVIEAKAAIACFLIGAKAENLMFNGRTAGEAYDAYCRLFGYDPVELEQRLMQREEAQPHQGTVWEQAHRDYK